MTVVIFSGEIETGIPAAPNRPHGASPVILAASAESAATMSAGEAGIQSDEAQGMLSGLTPAQLQRWFLAALTSTPDFHYVFDLDGRFCYVNSALADFLRRTPASIIGHTIGELGYSRELAASLQQRITQVTQSRQALRQETAFTAVGGDRGQRGYYEYTLTPVLNADGRVEAVAGSSRDITQRRQAEIGVRQARGALEREVRRRTSQLLQANQALQTQIGERQLAEQLLLESQLLLRHLAAHQDRVKEEERKRIAREIHDELGQNLLALRIDVSRLQARTGGTHPALNHRVSSALGNIDLSMQSVRNIINDLRPAALDLGLHAAIDWQIREFERRSGLACELVGEDQLLCVSLDDRRATALFRIVQESLANIARHASASRVCISLRNEAQTLSLEIADDGVGMDLAAARKNNSFGLVGLQERVNNLRGELVIDSAPGQGTALTISIPLAVPDDGAA